MKLSVLSFLLFTILLFNVGTAAQEKQNTATQTNGNLSAKTSKNPELRDELIRRLKAARDIRAELIKKYNGSIPAAELASIVKIDDENTAWIKGQIEKYGWLGMSLVGEDGEDAAFRLIRNATRDGDFQKQSLELLRKAVEKGEAPPEQIKLLTDRIGDNAAPEEQQPASKNGIPSAQRVVIPVVKSGAPTISEVKNPALREELLQRIKSDQAMRFEIIKNHPPGQKLPGEVLTRFKAIDKANTDWMKETMKKYGYPGYASVGRDGEQAAFAIIQHADGDLEFQKQALELLRRAVEAKDAPPASLAYLTDRVLVAEGKPQIYGTQTQIINGKITVNLIEDEANVDRRRAQIGLEPLADYLNNLQQRYKKP